MSHLSKIFEEAPVKVQNRNGFDLSHIHAGTSKTGQLVPVLTKLLPPNSTISLGVQAEVNLPPLVAPFYGKVDFAIEGFIVPCSILYGGWKQFISNQEQTQFPATQDLVINNGSAYTFSAATVVNQYTKYNWGKVGYALPYFSLITASNSNVANFTTLYSTNDNIYDYMGMAFRQAPSFSVLDSDIRISMLPGLAYHKICDVFYRNTKLTKTWFAVNPNTIGVSGFNQKNVSLIWHSFYTQNAIGTQEGSVGWEASSANFTSGPEMDEESSYDYGEPLIFPDGVSFFSTRQRTYNRDYFTSAVPTPQQGGAATLQFSISTGTSDGSFTINALRMANSLQKFLETNNLSGDYAEMMRNRWGVRPIDADFDEPHYLGRVVVPVYQHTVSQTVQTSGQEGGNKWTDLGILGADAAKGAANGEGSICDNFNVSTWSYLMVLASLYPHACYNYGLNRELTMTHLGDFPAPELQSVGMEEIKNYEVSTYATSGSTSQYLTSTFGYIPRFSRFKYMDDFASGELRPARTLYQYEIQRDFGTTIPQLGTDFVTIAQNALDNVFAVTTSSMKLSCWWEIYFNFKVVMPLADFCIPTLGDIQDTHTIKTTVGGSRL